MPVASGSRGKARRDPPEGSHQPSLRPERGADRGGPENRMPSAGTALRRARRSGQPFFASSVSPPPRTHDGRATNDKPATRGGRESVAPGRPRRPTRRERRFGRLRSRRHAETRWPERDSSPLRARSARRARRGTGERRRLPAGISPPDGRGQKAREGYAPRYSELLGSRPQPVHAISISGHQEFDVRLPLEHESRRLQEAAWGLLPGQAADEEDERPIVGERFHLVGVARIDRVVNNADLPRVDSVPPSDDARRPMRHAENAIRSAGPFPLHRGDEPVAVASTACILRGVDVRDPRLPRGAVELEGGGQGHPVVRVDEVEALPPADLRDAAGEPEYLPRKVGIPPITAGLEARLHAQDPERLFRRGKPAEDRRRTSSRPVRESQRDPTAER